MSLNKTFTGDVVNTGGGTALTFSPVAAKSVLANATNGSAVPAALAGSAAFQHLRVNSANNALEWAVISTGDFPANSVPVTALATIATDTLLANITAGTATPTAVAFATIDSASILWDATSHTFVLGAASGGDITRAQGSVTYTINNDSVTYAKIQNVSATNRFLGRITAGSGDTEELTGTQATTLLDAFTSGLKGLAPASGGGTVNFLRADGTWTAPIIGTFAGIRDNGTDENDRTNLNFLNGTNTTATITDDAGNDELEIRVNVDDYPLSGLADQAAETFVGNFTAGSAAPTALAGSTVAGAGLTYTTGGILAVGAGTRITVNANDVQLAAGAAESFLMNATAGSAVADYRAGSSVAGAGLTYTAGGTLAVGAGTNVTVNANDIAVTSFPLTGLATQAAETFVGNFTAGVATPTALAGNTVAGAGLTYTTGGILAVGAGTGITVNANDVAWTGVAVSEDGGATTNYRTIDFNTGFTTGATLTNMGGGVVKVIFDVVAGSIGSTELQNNSATNAKIADMAANTIKANVTGSTADPTDHSLTTLAGASLDYASGAINYAGTTSEINLASITGNQGTVNIAALECGGCVNVSSTADWSIEGFTAKADGFWFMLSANNANFRGTLFDDDATATATDRMRLTNEVDYSAIAIQAFIYYAESRWRVVVSGDSRNIVSVSGTQNALSLGGADIVECTTTTTINGISGGLRGRIVDIFAATGNLITVNHLSGSAASADQIALPESAAFESTRTGLRLAHDGTIWRTISTGTREPQVLLEVHEAYAADASYTITPPAGSTWFEAEMVAGGGGGGGADADANGEVCAGGGGGAGSYSRILLAIVSGNITGAIGAGGTAGSNAGGTGGTGGNTTLTYNGGTATAVGGAGGVGMSAGGGGATNAAAVAGGLGGNATAVFGERVFDGGAGGSAFAWGISGSPANGAGMGGCGGASFFGQGGLGNVVDQVAISTANGGGASAPGSGGGGAARVVNAAGPLTGATGGAGAAGCLIIKFYSGPVPGGAVIT